MLSCKIDTRERLDIYFTLHGEEATRFLRENSGDKRFVALVQIRDKVVIEAIGYINTYEEMVGPLDQTKDPDTFMKGLDDLIRGL